MPRIARLVVPGYPHHIVQRGNRRQDVFFSDKDKIAYIDYLHTYAKEAGISFWGYCLMDNHVHLIAVPEKEESLALGIGEAHKRYTCMINSREKWQGHLWQGRFMSYVLDEKHLYAALRYVERNPVRAKIVNRAENYRWSSARTHVQKGKDKLLSDHFLISEIKDWSVYLSQEDKQKDVDILQKHSNTGRPLGGIEFIEKIEKLLGRDLKKKKPGPKKE